MNKWWLKGGAVIGESFGDPETADILIEDGKIKAIAGNLEGADARVLDCRGKFIVPGFIDLQCHICEEWQEIEPAIEATTQAAVKGGFTTLCAMPDTNPPLDNEGMIGIIRILAETRGWAHILPSACATRGLQGKNLAEIGTLIAAGAALIYDSDRSIQDTLLLRRLMEYSQMFPVPLFLHCEDLGLSGTGAMHEGLCSTRFGIEGIPAIAEEVTVLRDLAIAAYTGTAIHITHVSTRGAVEAIRRAKAAGLPVTCSVTPHHLTLIDEDIPPFNTHFKVKPPLRGKEDREALVQGLKDGTVDCIVTDHRSLTGSGQGLDFAEAPFGCAGLETCFQVAYEYLVLQQGMPLSQLIKKMTQIPARILGISKGALQPGAAADLTVLNLQQGETIHPGSLLSDTSPCPFLGRTFSSQITACLVSGELRYRDGHIIPLETHS